MTSVCIIDFISVTNQPQPVSKQLESKRLCIETTVNPIFGDHFLYSNERNV